VFAPREADPGERCLAEGGVRLRPVDFRLDAPQSLEEALRLVGEQGDEAVVLAGGQTLIPLLNMRIARPDRVIDLSGVQSLDGITVETSELAVGAMTRQARLQTSEAVREQLPLLRYVVGFVGQVQTRSRGTVGGSVALGSSVAELCVTLLALEGRVKLERSDFSRWEPADAFFLDYLTTSLRPGELLTEVRFPKLGASTRWGFSELKFRGCDFPIVVVVVLLTFDGRRCSEARVAAGGLASTPIRLQAVESALVGTEVDDTTISRAAASAMDEVTPPSDLHAPSSYRSLVAVSEIERAIHRAVAA
jgi:CO/xanthine dehydrogenase FAD-binding subunit